MKTSVKIVLLVFLTFFSIIETNANNWEAYGLVNCKTNDPAWVNQPFEEYVQCFPANENGPCDECCYRIVFKTKMNPFEVNILGIYNRSGNRCGECSMNNVIFGFLYAYLGDRVLLDPDFLSDIGANGNLTPISSNVFTSGKCSTSVIIL